MLRDNANTSFKSCKKKVQERIGYLKVKEIFQFQLKLEENVETMQLTKTNFIQAKVVSHSMFNLLKLRLAFFSISSLFLRPVESQKYVKN